MSEAPDAPVAPAEESRPKMELAQLKAVIESPRPTSDLVDVIEEADNFGFPSGHASGALLVVGAISPPTAD